MSRVLQVWPLFVLIIMPFSKPYLYVNVSKGINATWCQNIKKKKILSVSMWLEWQDETCLSMWSNLLPIFTIHESISLWNSSLSWSVCAKNLFYFISELNLPFGTEQIMIIFVSPQVHRRFRNIWQSLPPTPLPKKTFLSIEKHNEL